MNSPPPSSPITGMPIGEQNSSLSSPPSFSRSAKPKAKPTITPRSFNRFFAPRSHNKTSRNVLGDITARSSNQQYRVRKRRSPKKESIKLFDEDENPESGSNNLVNSRKRALYSPESTPGSTPKRVKKSKRLRSGSIEWSDDTAEADFDHTISPSTNILKPVKRSLYRSRLGDISRREIDMPNDSFRKTSIYCPPDWRSQVDGFYTAYPDHHACRNLVNSDGEFALPFCTTACHRNSLIAVGDEEGTIRLLDAERSAPHHFKKPYLSFRPHVNAILDIDFSTDDALLATASGDQTGQVIDMPTQKTLYEMRGHVSSVKQVRFQPSSNANVLATSSRDGTIQLWDLRCKATSAPCLNFKVNLGGAEHDLPSTFPPDTVVKKAACVSLISDAHGGMLPVTDLSGSIGKPIGSAEVTATKKSAVSSRNEVSITSLSFISTGAPHLLASGSESNAVVKLWDLRMKQVSRARPAAPLSSTRQPLAHNLHRSFGLTSMVVGGDGSRLYTLCKDNTVYAYSIQHLILGSAPELSTSWKPRRNGEDKEGLGPLYAFRHEKLKVSTFYVKSALRTASSDKGELLAVGSTESCAIVFPTDERFLNRSGSSDAPTDTAAPLTPALTPTSSRPQLRRYNSGIATQRAHEDIQVYNNGASLENGHVKEVTSMTWTSQGELVTVGDDWRCRVWREDADKAAKLRRNDERNPRADGWADFGSSGYNFDDDEE